MNQFFFETIIINCLGDGSFDGRRLNLSTHRQNKIDDAAIKLLSFQFERHSSRKIDSIHVNHMISTAKMIHLKLTTACIVLY